MSNNTTNWILQLYDKVTAPMRRVTESVEGAEKKGNKLGDCFKRISAIDISAMSMGVESLSSKISAASAPGIAFDSQLREVSAITGLTGEALAKLGDNARESAKEFGGNAADQLEAYKTVLSRLGPDIGQSSEALGAMGSHIQTLSKTMGGDAVGATNALTTAMLQFQVDLKDPVAASKEMGRMMNVMAAGAKEGAAEVPQIGAALEQSGVQAKLAKLTFEETNAAIQSLAGGGKYGSEAGFALRNVLTMISSPSSLSKEAVALLSAYGVNLKTISDTSLPFADRLKALGPIQQDLNALTAVFGRENASNAQILIRSAEEQRELTGQITGTSVATEQAATIMGSFKERMAKTQAWLDDLKISFFNVAGGMLPFVEHTATAISLLADLKNAGAGVSLIVKSVKSLEIATKVMTAAQWLWNVAMSANPIGLLVVGIAALVAAIAVAIKYYDDWGAALLVFMGPIGVVIGAFKSLYDHWESIKKAFETDGIIGGLKRIGIVLLDALLKPVQQLLELVAKIPGMGGLAGGGAAKIAKLREGLDLVTPGEKEAKDKAEAKVEAKTEAKDSSVSALLSGKPSNSPVVPTGKEAKGKAAGMTVEGSGGSKAITMNLEIKNYFNVASGVNVREIADKIIGMVNDRLRDAAISM